VQGATLTHHSLLNSAYSIGKVMGFDKEEARICTPMPFYHLGGCMIGNLQIVAHNSALVVPSMGYDATSVLRAAQETRSTALYGSPTMYFDELAVLQRSKFDLSSVRVAAVGGSPLPPHLVTSIAEKMGVKDVRNLFGTSETCLTAMTRASDDQEQRMHSLGRPMDHVEVKIINSKGETCKADEVGELPLLNAIRYIANYLLRVCIYIVSDSLQRPKVLAS
jgi:fatty-acyl-CoA synthase